MAITVPELKPMLAGCIWVLLVLPAVAGMVLRYARRYEVAGTWSWRAWACRASGVATILLAAGIWWQMFSLTADPTTLMGVLSPLVQLPLLGLLVLALLAGNADQREDDEKWAAELLRQLQLPNRTVWSGHS
ncbi:hypothetical protein [Deinococcus aluminii]